MPWTETARRDYARRGKRYSSDLSDRKWALISPFLPEPRPVGRPRTTDGQGERTARGQKSVNGRHNSDRGIQEVGLCRGQSVEGSPEGLIAMNERWLVEDLILVGLLKVVQQGASLSASADMGAAEHLKTAARELIDQAPPNARSKIQRRVQATARRCISPSVTRDTHVATLGLAAYHLLEHLLDEGYVSIGTLSQLSSAIDMILPALEPAANDEEQMTDSRTTAIGIFQNLQKEGLFRGVVPMV